MGASLAFKGVAENMVIIHGSQGCSTYIRRHISAHYNEPVDIASSSLSEEGTVYGGAANLKLGIKNLYNLYQPKVIGVLTTCLAETIGDDIERIVAEVRKDFMGVDVDIIPVKTPGYGASQSEGYFYGIRALMSYYAKSGMASKHINVIISNATCEDIREVKNIFAQMQVSYQLFPDISNVLDAPYTNDYEKLSKEGTLREAFIHAANAVATIELGHLVHEQYSPGVFLQENFDIPVYRLPLPIGLESTDALIQTISTISGHKIPQSLKTQRGRLLDAMIDSHKYNSEGQVAIFGDMDLVAGITRLCLENGLKVKVVATGTPSSNFKSYITELFTRQKAKGEILQDSDFETIRERILELDVNLMLGTSDGKWIWEHDKIPLLRMGFPVHDNVGAQRRSYMGYRGTGEILDRITNTLLDRKHMGYRERMLDTYLMTKEG